MNFTLLISIHHRGVFVNNQSAVIAVAVAATAGKLIRYCISGVEMKDPDNLNVETLTLFYNQVFLYPKRKSDSI